MLDIEVVTRLLLERKISKTYLAKELKISRQALYGKLERRSKFSLEQALTIARVLGTDLDNILKKEDE